MAGRPPARGGGGGGGGGQFRRGASKGTIDSRRVVVYAVKYAGSVPTKACLLIIKKAASLKIL